MLKFVKYNINTRFTMYFMIYFYYDRLGDRLMYKNSYKALIVSAFCVTSVVALFLVWKTFSGGGTIY